MEITHDRGARNMNVFVIGTRAQLIKVAPIILACEKIGLPCILLMTGQHQETMQDIIEEFSIRSPQRTATVARERATVMSLIAWLPNAYRGILKKLTELKDACPENQINVLVHGDTLTTLLSAYCGRRLGLKVIHLESGLTSGKLFSPFPEEMIRRLVFRVTDIAICPDDISAAHMRNVSKAEIFNTHGNSIIDAANLVLAQETKDIHPGTAPRLIFSIHRFQNIYNKQRLMEMVELIVQLATEFEIYFILHPSTKKRLLKTGLMEKLSIAKNVHLSDRMAYGDFIRLVSHAECVLTDGGSNQEELAYLGIPTIIMRDYTERIDGIGKNAIMESSAEGGVISYLKDGKYKNLNKELRNCNESSPSDIIAGILKNM
jgi:UDP-N-acetylglucosamine 2-epimerase (non-hydrolysing)